MTDKPVFEKTVRGYVDTTMELLQEVSPDNKPKTRIRVQAARLLLEQLDDYMSGAVSRPLGISWDGTATLVDECVLLGGERQFGASVCLEVPVEVLGVLIGKLQEHQAAVEAGE